MVNVLSHYLPWGGQYEIYNEQKVVLPTSDFRQDVI